MLFILCGLLLTALLLPDEKPAWKAAFAFFFFLSAVPFFSLIIALVSRSFINPTLASVICLVVLTIFSAFAGFPIRNFFKGRFSRQEGILFSFAVLVGFVAWFYYSNEEFFLSLASYCLRGEAKCFYMQTFKQIAGLNPASASFSPTDFYRQISTPGNALYTGSFTILFGMNAFHLLYALFAALFFLFFALLLHHWKTPFRLIVPVALFAVFNPYSLSVEVLDRNAMAYALSAALFFAIFALPQKRFLHGLLLGLCAGVGLRFLYLTMLLPILVHYAWGKTRPREYALFFVGFLSIFAFNLPHLAYQGFSSLGETAPWWNLLWLTISEGLRTPMVPYPNTLLYPIHILAYLGYMVGGLILFGAGATWFTDRRRFVFLLLTFLPTYAVLAVQRDWIEADKLRIMLMTLLPLLLFAGQGLAALLDRRQFAKRIAVYLTVLFALVVAHTLLARCAAPPDATTYTKKPFYQHETETYQHFYRANLAHTSLWPNYCRLDEKLLPTRKNRKEQAVLQTFFSPEQIEILSQKNWLRDHLHGRNQNLLPQQTSGDFVNVCIDLAKLIDTPDQAVKIDPVTKSFFFDLSNQRELLDIYHKEVLVPWQPEKLPVTVLPQTAEFTTVGRVVVELNAFLGMGKDDFGFVKVNQINLAVDPMRHETALASGMTALPQRDDASAICLRVPFDSEILLRNWIVSYANGTPYRIDSWVIRLNGKKVEMTFFPLEPESYL